jgi:hypothetical protein
MANLRKYTRVPFLMDGVLRMGEQRIPMQVVDISLNGALVQPADEAAAGTGSDGVLELPLAGTDVMIRMGVSVAHSRGAAIGLRCTSIDLESMTHLRRLMELNLGDPHLVERELVALGRP